MCGQLCAAQQLPQNNSCVRWQLCSVCISAAVPVWTHQAPGTVEGLDLCRETGILIAQEPFFSTVMRAPSAQIGQRFHCLEGCRDTKASIVTPTTTALLFVTVSVFWCIQCSVGPTKELKIVDNCPPTRAEVICRMRLEGQDFTGDTGSLNLSQTLHTVVLNTVPCDL